MADPILEMRGITKAFHGVKALSNVNLAVYKKIHATLAKTALKSTLMKVLSGSDPHGDYEGEIRYAGADLQVCRHR